VDLEQPLWWGCAVFAVLGSLGSGTNGHMGELSSMTGKYNVVAAAAFAAGLPSPLAAHAQASQTYRDAEGKLELAELSPEKRAEIEQRMKAPGQNVREILETILLNSIKLKHPASRIVALDFGRGSAMVELPGGETRLVSFDTRTLAIKA
jgi:hypothetical protein